MPISTHAKKSLTPRQLKRRKRILEVVQQMISECGYRATSMQAIAAASDVAEKTLYNIFGSKDRLIAASARDRTAGVFEAARVAAPAGGMDFLVAMVAQIARASLEAPQLTRVLAPVLVENPTLVGLNEVYSEYVGAAYEKMWQSGKVENRDLGETFARALRFGLVSTVLFWSKGEISDGELPDFLAFELYQTLLPFLSPGEVDAVRQRAQRICIGRAAGHPVSKGFARGER